MPSWTSRVKLRASRLNLIVPRIRPRFTLRVCGPDSNLPETARPTETARR
jgi:hypothetical protein